MTHQSNHRDSTSAESWPSNWQRHYSNRRFPEIPSISQPRPQVAQHASLEETPGSRKSRHRRARFCVSQRSPQPAPRTAPPPAVQNALYQRSMQRMSASSHYLFCTSRESRVRWEGTAFAVPNRDRGVRALAPGYILQSFTTNFRIPNP